MSSLDRLRRYRRIAEVLANKELAFVAVELGLDHPLPRLNDVGRADRLPAEVEARYLREALEELGPTFVKLGQLLSTRPDLVPPAFVAEFVKLQDHAPAVPADAVKAVLQQEIGAHPDDVFSSFDPVPLASASIGQVHRAVLLDGTEVVVKVRRPDIADEVRDDLEILQNLALRASRRWPAAADANVVGLAAHFTRSMQAELDYSQEGRNAVRFAENLAGLPRVHVPRVHWSASSAQILTLERVTGVKVTDSEGLDRSGVDRSAVMRDSVDVLAHMLFVDGFFHADLHPGNLFIEPDGRIALIDFGAVGTLGPDLRDRLVDLLMGVTRNAPDAATTALERLCTPSSDVDRRALTADVAGFLLTIHGRSIGEVALGPIVHDLFTLLRRHRLQLPTDVITLARTVTMVDSMGATLDPDFRLADALRPHLTKLLMARYEPARILQELGAAGADLVEVGRELPSRLRQLFQLLDRGGIDVHLRHDDLEPLIRRTERAADRVVAGMLLSAAIGVVARNDSRTTAAAVDRRLLRGGLAAIGAITAYLAWTGRRNR